MGESISSNHRPSIVICCTIGCGILPIFSGFAVLDNCGVGLSMREHNFCISYLERLNFQIITTPLSAILSWDYRANTHFLS
jgi:hypothetical protein